MMSNGKTADVTASDSNALVITLGELKKYIEDEADFNRSWTDGRRHAAGADDKYIARRIELAKEREMWAIAIGLAMDIVAL